MAKPKGKTKRKDPKRRPVDAVAPWIHIADKDPNRRYVWVNAGDQHSLSQYTAIGYDVETWQFDSGEEPVGPRPAAGRTMNRRRGEEITMMDCILMSIDNGTYEDIVRRGPFGDSGLDEADAVESRMLEPGGMDPLRGMTGFIPGRHMSVQAMPGHGQQQEER